MNRSTYKKIAKQYGVSVEEVKREMQLAIFAAYKNPTPEALAIPRKGAIPNVTEFVNYCAKKIEK